MSVVVDTNVIAYYLLRTEPFVEEVSAFWREGHDAVAPASWEAELCNVLWLAARAEVIDSDTALHRLSLARRLGITSVPVVDLWEAALVRAVQHDHPAYDTLFVELAVRTGGPLVTYDEQLLAKFAGVARRPADVR